MTAESRVTSARSSPWRVELLVENRMPVRFAEFVGSGSFENESCQKVWGPSGGT